MVEGEVFLVACKLKNTNCFGFGAIMWGINGVPVKLATRLFRSDAGLATGEPVGE